MSYTPHLRKSNSSHRHALLRDGEGTVVDLGFQCHKCDDFIFGEPGHWNENAVFCGQCARSGQTIFSRLRVPPKYVASSLDKMTRAVRHKVLKWPKTSPQLLLSGAASATSWALARYYDRAKNIRVTMQSTSRLHEDWKREFATRSNSSVLAKFRGVGLLCLLEFARAGDSDRWKESIADLILWRSENARPTILATSLPAEDVFEKDMVSKRLADLLLSDFVALEV